MRKRVKYNTIHELSPQGSEPWLNWAFTNCVVKMGINISPQACVALATSMWVVDIFHCLKMLQVWELVYPKVYFLLRWYGSMKSVCINIIGHGTHLLKNCGHESNKAAL